MLKKRFYEKAQYDPSYLLLDNISNEEKSKIRVTSAKLKATELQHIDTAPHKQLHMARRVGIFGQPKNSKEDQ